MYVIAYTLLLLLLLLLLQKLDNEQERLSRSTENGIINVFLSVAVLKNNVR